MGINFDTGLFRVGFRPKVQLNNRRNIYFGNIEQPNDSFENNSVDRFFNEDYIKNAIKQNPEIAKILSSRDIPIKINMEILQDLKQHHCSDTAEICAQIVKNLPKALKDKVDLKDLKDAAMLHDFGKVLIPENILNKPGVLYFYEHKIIDLHSQIGYELLKNSGLNDQVLKLIHNHHNADKFGDINLEILSLADKYSALTERRPYKDSFSAQKALFILSKQVNTGEIDRMVFNALVKAVSGQKVNNSVNIS